MPRLPSARARRALPLFTALLFVALQLAAPDPARAQALTECTNGTAIGPDGTTYDCQDADLLSHLSIQELGGSSFAELNDLWGWTDPQTGNRYALVGRTDGAAFVDVTNPQNPIYLGELPPNGGNSTWRDIKVFENHAFIGSEAGGHGVQVFDLTKLRTLASIPQTFSADTVYTHFGASHNLIINEESGRLYGVGITGSQNVPSGSGCGPGYHGVDISDPENPQFAGCFNSSLGGYIASGYTHDAQCVTYDGPDTEHQGAEICVGSDETGISVADLTDLQNPVELATATYPNTGYSHQGWFGENQRYFYHDDETDEVYGLVSSTRTLVWDLQDLDAPVLVTQHSGTTGSSDHNQYVKGDYTFQANYKSGLRILDVSDPTAPVEVGFFDTFPTSNSAGFDGAWSNYPFFGDGLVIVSDISNGLFVLDATDALPVELASFTARADEGDAVLQWRTLSETQSEGFEIQEQRRGGSFRTVGYEKAAGTTTAAQEYTHRVENVGAGRHVFRLVQIDRDGTRTTEGTRTLEIAVSGTHALSEAFPNPARQEAHVHLAVKATQEVRVAVYDLLGRRVQTLFDGTMPAGDAQRFSLDATDLPSGPYFVRVIGENFSDARSVTLVK